MKYLLFFMVVFTMLVSAQDSTKFMNPDGTLPSIHFSPFISRIDRYLDGRQTDGGYDNQLGFELTVKIPASPWVTIALNCSYQNLKWRQDYYYQDLNFLRTGNGSLKQESLKMGMIFSYYFK